jgi:hypothetical protein
MTAAAVVDVVGMKALRRDLNRLADDTKGPLYQAIKAAGRKVAAPVADRARQSLPAGDRTTGRLQRNVRVSATRTGAAVRMGSKAVPYAGWVEFGGTRRAPHESSRPYIPTGRYLFPAAYALAGKVAADYSSAIGDVLSSAKVWTNTGANPHD